MAEAKWTGRLSRVTLRLGIAMIVVIAIGVTLAFGCGGQAEAQFDRLRQKPASACRG